MVAAIVNISTIIWSSVIPNSPPTLPLDVVRDCAQSAMDKYQRGGSDALSLYLAQASSGCPGAVLVDATHIPPKNVLKTKLSRADLELAEVVRSSGQLTLKLLPWRTLIALPVVSETSSSYIYIATAWALRNSFPLRVALQVMTVALVSGVFCYVLTLYFGKPLTRLGRMAEELGAGDLSARIDDSLTRRKDEFGDLAQSFNRMAAKIEMLVADYKNFLAHVSHELGSPLTRVNIALALARRKADALLEPELDRIDYETNHLNMLVQELLLLARLESGNELSRETTSFNVASVIEEACADARFEATQIQKSIIVERDEDFNVTGYRDLLRRALDNILRNGVRFARESGCIRVEFFASSGGAVGIISIRDDGPGIDPDQEQAIFEPFITLQNRGTITGTGSGLGLAIARQAVLVNGGKICARNSEHGGLTVTIELPVPGCGLSHKSA